MQHCQYKSSIQRAVDSLHQQIGLNVWKKLVKCYICSIALYGAETWDTSESRSEVLKCGGGTAEKVSWNDRVEKRRSIT